MKLELKLIFIDLINDLLNFTLRRCRGQSHFLDVLHSYKQSHTHLILIDNVSASGCGFNGGTLFGHGLKIQFRIPRLMAFWLWSFKIVGPKKQEDCPKINTLKGIHCIL